MKADQANKKNQPADLHQNPLNQFYQKQIMAGVCHHIVTRHEPTPLPSRAKPFFPST
jgi:hypothetical protein